MSLTVVKATPKELREKFDEIHDILFLLGEKLPPNNIRLKLDLQGFTLNYLGTVLAVAEDLAKREAELKDVKPEKRVFSESMLTEARRIIGIHVATTKKQCFMYKEIEKTAMLLNSPLASTPKNVFARIKELTLYRKELEQIQTRPYAVFKVPDETYRRILAGGTLKK